MYIKELMQTNFELAPVGTKISMDFFAGTDCEYLISIEEQEKEIMLFKRESIIMEFCQSKKDYIIITNQLPGEKFILIKEDTDVQNLPWMEKSQKKAVIINQDNEPVGVIGDIWSIALLSFEWKSMVFRNQLRLEFFKKIFNSIEDEVFVTDEYGFIQYLNPVAERVCDISQDYYMGKHVTDLEHEHIISTSITMNVLKTRERSCDIIKMKTGKTILASAVPVFDENGVFTNVISTSKDVEEINNLLNELEQQKSEIGLKEKEILKLKERIITQDNYIMQSDVMRDVQKTIIKVAPTDISILIQGESGVGKEVVTDLIHKLSPRYDKPLIKINCGLIPENLLESELFGYESGAFTGATKGGKIGKIELAHKGTVFFDEIGELPLSLQVKLLEFLQDREMTRIGGIKKIPIDTRVVAATNRDLRTMVSEGKFRSDLYYRLNVMPIMIPPLRSRHDDVIPLARLFLHKYNRKYNVYKKFSSEVLSAFLDYSWQGNVRELMHVVERLVVTSDDDMISSECLKGILSSENSQMGNVICTGLLPLKLAKSQLEYELVMRAYEMFHSTYKAAEALSIDQSTVVKIMKKHGYKHV